MAASSALWGIHKSVTVCGLQVLNGNSCNIETVILQELHHFLGVQDLGEDGEELAPEPQEAEELWGLAVSVSHDWGENASVDDNTLGLEVYEVHGSSRWKAMKRSATENSFKQTIGLLFLVGSDGKLQSNVRRLSREKQSALIPNATAMSDCLGRPMSVAIRAFLAGWRCDAPFAQVWDVCKKKFMALVNSMKTEEGVELLWKEAQLHQISMRLDPPTQLVVEHLLPHFGMATGVLILPMLLCLTKRRLRIEELGAEYTKHFLLLHLLSILSKAGLQQSQLARVSAQFSSIFDGMSPSCADSIQLTIRVVPHILEHAIQAPLTGTPHEGVIAYVSVLLLLELVKSPSVQLVIGHIDLNQRQAIPKLSQVLVRRAILRLHGVFEELGAICPEPRILGKSSGGGSALEAVARNGGVPVPQVPETSVIGIAAHADFVTALLVSRGCTEVRRALTADQVHNWRDKIMIGTWVEYLCRDTHNWVIAQVTKTPTANTLVLAHADLIARRPRAATDIRPVGLEGAIVDWVGFDDLACEQVHDECKDMLNYGLDLSDMSPLPSPRSRYTLDDVDGSQDTTASSQLDKSSKNTVAPLKAVTPDISDRASEEGILAEPEGDLSTVASEAEL